MNILPARDVQGNAAFVAVCDNFGTVADVLDDVVGDATQSVSITIRQIEAEWHVVTAAAAK
jgi:hypothetical protein